MATPRYLPVATFKQWWKTETTADDSLIEAAINAAEVAIDNALQRKMIVAGSATSRMFRPNPRSRILVIDDATTVTAVTEDSASLTANTDYILEPLNGLSGAGETVPYSSIRRLDSHWYTYDETPTVTVTGTWGWAAIPFEVVESCKIIAADMLSNRDMRNGLVAITEAGGVGSRENLTVRNMVAKYRSSRSWGIA